MKASAAMPFKTQRLYLPTPRRLTRVADKQGLNACWEVPVSRGPTRQTVHGGEKRLHAYATAPRRQM